MKHVKYTPLNEKNAETEMVSKIAEKGPLLATAENTKKSDNTNESKKTDDVANPYKKHLTLYELMLVLSPYFWPASGSDGAIINRIRSTSTWLMVAASKTCNLIAPLFLSMATNELVNKNFSSAVKALLTYTVLRFASSTFKELQSIIYIKVKQQASIELQELAFTHLHMLSLNWHLSKKTGSVMKSMDRGIESANTLITYLFLYLLPAILECLAVVILFLVQVFYQYMITVNLFPLKDMEFKSFSLNKFYLGLLYSLVFFSTLLRRSISPNGVRNSVSRVTNTITNSTIKRRIV